jgi:hypothetical protein
MGGTESLAKMFKDRRKEKDLQTISCRRRQSTLSLEESITEQPLQFHQHHRWAD